MSWQVTEVVVLFRENFLCLFQEGVHSQSFAHWFQDVQLLKDLH